MHVSWESLANDHILGIAPYEPGKAIEELERELGLTDVIKLATGLMATLVALVLGLLVSSANSFQSAATGGSRSTCPRSARAPRRP